MTNHNLTKSLTGAELVTLVVYLLGGAQNTVDTEDIAKRANDLSPGRFVWKKYPDQINLELIRVFLSNARREDEGKLLMGSGKSGWNLTLNGLNWAKDAADSLAEINSQETRTRFQLAPIDRQRQTIERSRIRTSKAWKLWHDENKLVSPTDAKEIFRIDIYGDGALRERKFARLLSLFSDDPKISSFLNYLVSIIANSVVSTNVK